MTHPPESRPPGWEHAYRELQGIPGATQAQFESFLESFDTRLSDPSTDRSRLCRELLFELTYGRPAHEYDRLLEDASTPLAVRLQLLNLDPRNTALEAEYYVDVDPERFAKVKPLLWFWLLFDRTPLARNDHFGILVRRVLARHVFRRCGRNVKIFRDVEFSYGYNLEVGDDVVMHHHVFLDDRGGITIGSNVSLSDYANVYSHAHDVDDIFKISLAHTRIGDFSRVTYHAVVLSGVQVADHAMIGSMGVASKNVGRYHVCAGIPARPIAIKPGAPDELKRQFEEAKAAGKTR